MGYGEFIKDKRREFGLSLKKLSKETGISVQNLSRWEREEVLPNIDFCVRLANYYDISLDCLVGRFEVETIKKEDRGILLLSDEERKLLNHFRELGSNEKKAIKILCNTFYKDKIKN